MKMDGFLNKIGLGLGEFDLKLERHDLKAGEKVRGVFRFKLKRIVNARAVLVGVRAYRGKPDPEIEPEYDFQLPLDGADKYHEASYKFELLIPHDVLGPGGVIGQVGKAMSFLKNSGKPKKKLSWEVWACLDIPKQANPVRTLQITVSPPDSITGRSRRTTTAAPETGFYDYQPPSLPKPRAKPEEPQVKVDDKKVEQAVQKAKKSVEKAEEKKKNLRHYAPPAVEKPSRLRLPEPSYDDLPKMDRKKKR